MDPRIHFGKKLAYMYVAEHQNLLNVPNAIGMVPRSPRFRMPMTSKTEHLEHALINGANRPKPTSATGTCRVHIISVTLYPNYPTVPGVIEMSKTN